MSGFTGMGYANFAVADPALKLVLLENPGQGGSTTGITRGPAPSGAAGAGPVAGGADAGTTALAESDSAGVTAAPTAGGGVAGRDTVVTWAGRLRSGV